MQLKSWACGESCAATCFIGRWFGLGGDNNDPPLLFSRPAFRYTKNLGGQSPPRPPARLCSEADFFWSNNANVLSEVLALLLQNIMLQYKRPHVERCAS